METSKSCYVDENLYPHLLTIPAVIIVAVLAFLNKRQSFKTDVWGGRPGLVVPLNFLGVDHNRLTISAIFAVSTGLILQVVLRVYNESDEAKWVKAVVTIGYALEVAILFFPFFACLTTEHRLIGSIMGLLYSFMWFILEMFYKFDKCRDSTLPIILISIPLIICHLFIMGKFSTVVYLVVRRRISWTGESNHDGRNSTFRSELTKPWSIQHVKEVLKPRCYVPEKRWIRLLRLIYSPERNFRFSTQTVSIVVVCSIFLFQITVEIIHFGRMLLELESGSYFDFFEAVKEISCNTNLINALGGSLVASTLLLALLCSFLIVRFMECHKNRMLLMFKGDTSFIPKRLRKSQLMVGRCLKYAGYHIGYFVWGYILLMFFFVFFTLFIGLLFRCEKVWDLVESLLEYTVPYFLVTLPLWIFLIVSSMTVFRDGSFKKEVIAIDNRNVYLVSSYLFFFLGLPMGFFSAILRILIAMPISFFMLPRVDQCVMLDGFQRFDFGYAAYICYLHVQAAHRNPVLRVFCQVVYDGMQKLRESADGTLKTTKRYRNKWFLLLTLMRNPQLQECRKHVIAPPVVRFVVNAEDVSVQMPNFGGKM